MESLRQSIGNDSTSRCDVSLTSEISEKRSPVAQFFAKRFPDRPAFMADWRGRVHDLETIGRVATPLSGAVGAALDYRIRFCLGPVDLHRTVAFHGAIRLAYALTDPTDSR